jgi:hypothetical protein
MARMWHGRAPPRADFTIGTDLALSWGLQTKPNRRPRRLAPRRPGPGHHDWPCMTRRPAPAWWATSGKRIHFDECFRVSTAPGHLSWCYRLCKARSLGSGGSSTEAERVCPPMAETLLDPSDHPYKDVREALKRIMARSGWRLVKAGHWGHLRCDQGCCDIPVNRTPEVPSRDARDLERRARRHPLDAKDPRSKRRPAT